MELQGDALELREALKGLFDAGIIPDPKSVAVCPPCIHEEGFSTNSEWCGKCSSDVKKKCAAIYMAKKALDRPARICDKMDRHKATYDCRTFLTRHGYRLTSKQEEIMWQTIMWLYDPTKAAEVLYER